jgi:hypothetical protein
VSKKQTMDFHEAMEEVNLRFDGMIADDILYSPLSFREIAAKYDCRMSIYAKLPTSGASTGRGAGEARRTRMLRDASNPSIER